MGKTYKVYKNDTLWDIAENNNVDINDLMKWNNLSTLDINDPSILKEGQILNLEEPKVSNSATVSAPTLNPLPTAPTYDTTKWDDTTKGQAASEAYKAAQEALNKFGNFSYANQGQMDSLMNSILNREDFSYNFNEDALYQQYKDKYIQQGKLAMGDAIGQASAMTGGYGNSYAQSVGQQMYQKELQNLNDIIPTLYQMALDKYNMDGQALYDKYGLLSDDYNRAYGEHMDEYNRLMDALGIARSDYYDGSDMFYTEQNNQNSVAGQTFNDAMSIWTAESDNAWNTAKWDEDARRRAEDLAYQTELDKVADEQWQKTYDETVRQNNLEYQMWLREQKLAEKKYGDSMKVEEETPEQIQPKETQNTSAFVNRYPNKDEYIKQGHSEKEFNEYMESNIASFLRDDRISEEEALWLINYYGL